MRTLKFTSLFFLILLFASCASRLPLNQSFYNTKKVGVIIQVDSIGIAKTGSQGLLDMALTPGNKYKGPLHAVAMKLNPEALLAEEISSLLKAKNKDFIIIPFNVINQNLVKFEAPEASDKKYYKNDLRAIKTKYNVDELLYVRAKYGLLISYYSMVETGRQGHTELAANIINLDDNSLLLQDKISSVTPLKGKWNEEPEYENLTNSIKEAIALSIVTLKTKF